MEKSLTWCQRKDVTLGVSDGHMNPRSTVPKRDREPRADTKAPDDPSEFGSGR